VTRVDEFRTHRAATGLPAHGRNETPLERCDRNLVELLQEVRVVQTGVTSFQRFVTLLAAGAAAVLLIAPTAYHRILFRLGDKEHLVQVANCFTLAGLACVAISMIGALLLVTDLMFDGATVIVTVALAAFICVGCWALLPLLRRRKLRT
jgi:hypothetical protein